MTDGPVAAIPGLGPRWDEAFARAEIRTAAELRAIGAEEGYRRLLAAGTRAHFSAFCVLVTALQGRRWSDLDAVEKSRLRARFDALAATTGGTSTIETDLDRLGVPPRE